MLIPHSFRALCAALVFLAGLSPAAASAQAAATLQYPEDGATNVDLSQVARWSAVAGAEAYYLWVGSTPAASDIINSGELSQTAYPIAYAPIGQVLYARLWTKIAGVWRFVDSTFAVSPLIARFIYPLSGATNVDLSQPFRWTPVAGAQAYYLYIGSTPGGKDVRDTGELQSTSYPVSDVPSLRTLHVRLWTKVGGVWRYIDSQFSGAPVTPAFTYPVPGTLVGDPLRAWTWTSVWGAQAYYLYVGTTPAAKDLLQSGELQQRSFFVPGLPAGPVFARLWVKVDSVWRFTDATFTMPQQPARLSFPADGQTTVDRHQSARWSGVTGADAYYLYVGSAVGAKDLLNSGEIQQTQLSIETLPAGRRVYARLWTRIAGVWSYSDSTFTTLLEPAALVSPPAGSSTISPHRPFTWNGVEGAEAYYLYVGSTPGANDVINSGEMTQTSYTPPDGWDVRTGSAVAWDVPADPAAVSGYAMYFDNARVDLGPQLASSCNDAPATTCYRAPLPPRTAGTHTVKVSGYNEGHEAVSAPVVLSDPDPTVYARLWTKLAGTWQYSDSSFIPATLSPTFTYPEFGATNVDPARPIQWTAVPGADAYSLALGFTSGSSDLLYVELAVRSYFAPILASLAPGIRVVARLGARVDSVWRYSETIFGTIPLANLALPYHNATQVPLSSLFSWTQVPDAQAYYLYLGTSVGAKDLVNSGELSRTEVQVNNLPPGTTVFARLWTKGVGTWRFVDSQFTTQ